MRHTEIVHVTIAVAWTLDVENPVGFTIATAPETQRRHMLESATVGTIHQLLAEHAGRRPDGTTVPWARAELVGSDATGLPE